MGDLMARRENWTSVKCCLRVSTAITWHLEGRRTGSFSAALGLLALSPPALLSPFPARDFATRFLGWPLGLFFTLKSSSINCQSHSGAVISTLPCQGPCLSGGVVPPSSQRLVGPSPLFRLPPLPTPFSWTSERGRLPQFLSHLLASTPSDTCTDPPAAANPYLSSCLGQRVPASSQVYLLLILGLLAAWSCQLCKFASFRTTCHSCKHLLSHSILKITVQAKST